MKKVDTPKPEPTLGLHHVALIVEKFDDCVHFYTRLMGMDLEWQPDENHAYLTSGSDNLALHRAPENFKPGHQRLSHMGFIVKDMEQVDIWYDYLRDNQVDLDNVPTNHRDGARSFYCKDPDGNHIQVLYHPPLVANHTAEDN